MAVMLQRVYSAYKQKQICCVCCLRKNRVEVGNEVLDERRIKEDLVIIDLEEESNDYHDWDPFVEWDRNNDQTLHTYYSVLGGRRMEENLVIIDLEEESDDCDE